MLSGVLEILDDYGVGVEVSKPELTLPHPEGSHKIIRWLQLLVTEQ